MRLSEARCLFSYYLSNLLLEMFKAGYWACFDEVTERLTTRDPTSDHMAGSVHHLGLGGDVNLYSRGEDGSLTYLDTTEAHRMFGEIWEAWAEATSYPLRWGGRFGDGNHYSWEWEGRK